jgi:hypothetical protein
MLSLIDAEDVIEYPLLLKKDLIEENKAPVILNTNR